MFYFMVWNSVNFQKISVAITAFVVTGIRLKQIAACALCDRGRKFRAAAWVISQRGDVSRFQKPPHKVFF